MNKLQDFIDAISGDKRLKPFHLSLCMAFCKAWIKSGFHESFQISRRELMQSSRILSTATYHKVVKDLQAFGYLKYKPSYHPIHGSTVSLLANPEV